jgi:hypothetical protein
LDEDDIPHDEDDDVDDEEEDEEDDDDDEEEDNDEEADLFDDSYDSEEDFYKSSSKYTGAAKNLLGWGRAPHKIPLRASTAPARPLTELEEFWRSSEFLLLENTIMIAGKLRQRPTDEKYDLDSSEGQRICKRFLSQLERLCEVRIIAYWKVFQAECAARNYRKKFSKAYRVLFKEGCLCYLTEILDSAQEGWKRSWFTRVSIPLGKWRKVCFLLGSPWSRD